LFYWAPGTTICLSPNKITTTTLPLPHFHVISRAWVRTVDTLYLRSQHYFESTVGWNYMSAPPPHRNSPGKLHTMSVLRKRFLANAYEGPEQFAGNAKVSVLKVRANFFFYFTINIAG